MIKDHNKRFPILQGILPIDRSQLGPTIAAGVTLAALGIPEVMGYTSIAGMPVVTGLYTILIPIAVFAVLGSSKHLVVGADSATAAIMAAGLAGMATTQSDQYVALAGLVAIMAGVILILARLIKLGFIADFLSRSVLIGFLTGVGIQVALGQAGDMLGIPAQDGGTVEKFINTLGDFSQRNTATIAVSAAVLLVIIGGKAINRKFPWALLAVVGSIVVSWAMDLSNDGVATLGPVPGGLPSIGLPDVSASDIGALIPTALAIFVVILAQSAATSRAYAAKYAEQFDENVDLVGLGVASVSAGLSGTFVVNGSPTKSQMVDSAGGRNQLAMLTTAAIVLLVLLFFTKPLQYMPTAVLASVVFVIGIELIDIGGMRAINRLRIDEFLIAVLTAAVVVFVGVEQAIVLAIIISIINHLRFSYKPNDSVLVRNAEGRWHSVPVAPNMQAAPGVVVYRFAADLYYANANRLNEEVLSVVDEPSGPVHHLILDAASMFNVDYTGAETILQVLGELDERDVRLLIAQASSALRAQLDRLGITDAIGTDAYFATVSEAIEHATQDSQADSSGTNGTHGE